MSLSIFWLRLAWATKRKQKTSSIWRLRPTSASCNWWGIRRSRLPAKRTLAWPAYTTSGMIWMLPCNTGNRAPNWRGR